MRKHRIVPLTNRSRLPETELQRRLSEMGIIRANRNTLARKRQNNDTPGSCGERSGTMTRSNPDDGQVLENTGRAA